MNDLVDRLAVEAAPDPDRSARAKGARPISVPPTGPGCLSRSG